MMMIMIVLLITPTVVTLILTIIVIHQGDSIDNSYQIYCNKHSNSNKKDKDNGDNKVTMKILQYMNKRKTKNKISKEHQEQ